METHSPWIVMLNGPPNVGKTTAAGYMANNIGALEYPLARVLKEKTHAFFGVNLPWNYFEGAAKDTPMPMFEGMSPRQAYIWMSEEVIKPKFGRGYFGRRFVAWVHDHYCAPYQRTLLTNRDIVVVSDTGFPEELAEVTAAFGVEKLILVRLTAKGHSFIGDSRNFLDGDGLKYVLDVVNEKHDIEFFGADLVARVQRILSSGV